MTDAVRVDSFTYELHGADLSFDGRARWMCSVTMGLRPFR